MTKKGFGILPDKFATAIERYGIWPLTVWECNYTDKQMQELKREIGDTGKARDGSLSVGYMKWSKEAEAKKRSARAECFTKETDDESVNRGVITESIFNPAVAIWIMNLYGPEKGEIVYDPFAGGGTRAIVAGKKGYKYIGVELREEEVVALRDRCEANEVEAEIILGDSRKVPQIEDETADFLITCPPYYDLEKYRGGENDLSMALTYDDFLDGLYESIEESYRILKPGALSCWVVGLIRDKQGELLAMNHDVAGLHREAGFKFKEEIILYLKGTGSIQRVGMFDKGNHFLVRTHEYVLVFKKEAK